MTKRKFYKTLITFEVLSEEPIDDSWEMRDIVYQCNEGNFSGATVKNEETVLDGKETAAALIAQHSSPGFFRIDEDGNDAE